MRAIPRIIHIVWVGDEALCPYDNIQTWSAANPAFDVKLWGNNELANCNWHNNRAIKQFQIKPQLCGVADVMRWEILFEHGGFSVDADAVCLKSLPDWL